MFEKILIATDFSESSRSEHGLLALVSQPDA